MREKSGQFEGKIRLAHLRLDALPGLAERSDANGGPVPEHIEYVESGNEPAGRTVRRARRELCSLAA